jgi:uncharacterized protein (TIGR00266 family)
MDNTDVMAKYQQFVDDYNSGFDRARLCGKYKLTEEKFDSFLEFLKRKGFVLIAPLSQTIMTHEIDYQIFGDDMQFVEIELDPGETAIAEAGVLMYMDSWIEMETIFGDGSASSQGVTDRIFGAGKRVLTGASLFMTAFTNHGPSKKKVAFAAPYPGKIVPLNLGQLGGEMICQKEAFLCAAKGISIDIAFQKKLGIGIFGGEGFIMQRLTGNGLAFVHAGGTLIQKNLQPGETLKVDAGCLVALQPGVDFDIQFVGGIKNALFGGEGLFFATVTGPGTVWLQSLPFSRVIALINSRQPRTVDGGTIPGTSPLPVKETAIVGGIGGLLGGLGGLFGNKDD